MSIRRLASSNPAGAITRRAAVTGLAAGAASLALPTLAQTGAVRIGYAIPRTGAMAGGAQVSQDPNYIMWAEQQNAAGGLNVKGTKRQIELISFDDRSEVETTVRTYEKLMGSDKVDLILAPYGSNYNFAVAPLANRYGYPMLSPSALSRKLVDMQLPNFFSLLQQPDRMMGSLVELLVAQGVKSVAIVYMDDLFGLENFAALNAALKKTSIQVLERKGYPLGVKDLSPVLRTIKDQNPDAFIGITYPPDTILASKQAKEIGFNPRFFYAAVGVAFPVYKNVMGPACDGVLGMASWGTKTSANAKAYFEAHVKKFNKEPDRWASGHCWAGLEILTAAVAKHGLDRKAIRSYIATSEHDTIIGKVKFTGSEISVPGSVGQWQNGDVEVVWPKSMATASVLPKPAWK